MDDLKNNIESLREKLYVLIQNHELTNIEVVTCSKELDKLIVQYVDVKKLSY